MEEKSKERERKRFSYHDVVGVKVHKAVDGEEDEGHKDEDTEDKQAVTN